MVLNFITLLTVALAGAGIIFYVLFKKLRKKDTAPPDDPEKDDPIIHIRNKLFFQIPVERILLGYFSLIALIYLAELIIGIRYPGLDLLVLYLSGLIFCLIVYKMAMIGSVADKFNPWLLFSLVFSAVLFYVVLKGMDINLRDFLAETRDYHLTIHFLGLAMGLGGTFITDIMFSHFLRNYTIAAWESVIMHLISQMIILGLFLLLLSGAVLIYIDPQAFLNNPRFLMKITVVLIVLINGGALNLYVTPQMKKISLRKEEQGSYEKLTKISFALGAVSIVSWLSAFLLAMLKDLFTMPYLQLLIGYLVIVVISIVGSQFFKVVIEKKEAEEN